MLDENTPENPSQTVRETPGAEPDPSAAAANEKPADKAPAKKAPAKRTAKKTAAKRTTTKKAAAKRTAAPEDGDTPPLEESAETTQEKAPAKKATARTTTKKAAAKKAPAKRTATKKATAAPDEAQDTAVPTADETADQAGSGAPAIMPLFQAPDPVAAPRRRSRKTASPAPEAASETETTAGESAGQAEGAEQSETAPAESGTDAAPTRGGRQQGARGGKGRAQSATSGTDGDSSDGPGKEDQAERKATADAQTGTGEDDSDSDGEESEGGGRRRRRRGGRRRRKPGEGGGDSEGSATSEGSSTSEGTDSSNQAEDRDGSGEDSSDEGGEGTSRRRRRRRRSGDDGGDGPDDPQNTVTRVRKGRSAEDEITAVAGSTRLEAKKQRRREGREAGRRRAPIVSEAEFLARRESVERVMVVRQRDDLTQIAVLEDKVLVEHYVARESQTSLIGNVYLGRVQNVLPSMEAAFIDIGKGRNAVLYAGEVNWSALGHKDGQPRKIESVLSSGQSILVQVTKDPIGHKGARLTSQISLAGRFLVYVPDGTTSGISRKLPDTERSRLKRLLKEIVPESAGVIVRTAAEGASEDELTRDVERLKARWDDIEAKTKGSSPQLLYGEPDLTLKVVRDLFTEDFAQLVIEGQDAWDTVQGYVSHVAPDLEERLERYQPEGNRDVFAAYRIDEQIAKGLDRKVWLPSGGSLVIDRTEAMTVVDVNTGKFTGSGGNLEETVTKNNLEAAEEMVRQLRLRDIGGIIVIDFIDMVLESNRDLVLRRLVECLGRDRTRHQVAEVTSLGLVQMTRKRIGTGLVEAFSENCTACQGRGVVIHDAPVESRQGDDDGGRRGGGGRRSRGRGGNDKGGNQGGNQGGGKPPVPSPKDVAAVAKPENADKAPVDEQPAESTQVEAAPEQVREPEGAAPSQQEVPATDAPGQEPGQEPGPVEPPKVVTRTRRRAATRPAGSPVVGSTPAQPVTITVDATPSAEVETPASEPPKVVTRTRGRRASRQAGPAGETPTVPPEGSGAGPDSEGDPEQLELHVPVKKKGARKR